MSVLARSGPPSVLRPVVRSSSRMRPTHGTSRRRSCKRTKVERLQPLLLTRPHPHLSYSRSTTPEPDTPDRRWYGQDQAVRRPWVAQTSPDISTTSRSPLLLTADVPRRCSGMPTTGRPTTRSGSTEQRVPWGRLTTRPRRSCSATTTDVSSRVDPLTARHG